MCLIADISPEDEDRGTGTWGRARVSRGAERQTEERLWGPGAQRQRARVRAVAAVTAARAHTHSTQLTPHSEVYTTHSLSLSRGLFNMYNHSLIMFKISHNTTTYSSASRRVTCGKDGPSDMLWKHSQVAAVRKAGIGALLHAGPRRAPLPERGAALICRSRSARAKSWRCPLAPRRPWA